MGGLVSGSLAPIAVAGHMLTDFAALILAWWALVLSGRPADETRTYGFDRVSVLAAVIILRSAWAVVRELSHILLEETPRGFDRDASAANIARQVDGIVRVHHMHAWSITQGRPMVTLEVDIRDMADAERIRTEVKALLREQYGVGHATVEITD